MRVDAPPVLRLARTVARNRDEAEDLASVAILCASSAIVRDDSWVPFRRRTPAITLKRLTLSPPPQRILVVAGKQGPVRKIGRISYASILFNPIR